MKMADTPEARKDLDKALHILAGTYTNIYGVNVPPTIDGQFELIWSSACKINRLLGKHSVNEVTASDDVQNKPYKGSDSVPF